MCESIELLSTTLWHLRDSARLFELCLFSKAHFRDASAHQIATGNFYSLIGSNDRAIDCFKMASATSNYSLCLEGHEWIGLGDLQRAENVFLQLSKRDGLNFNAWYFRL